MAQVDRAIVEATITTLDELGFSRLTLNGIARACGKSTATVTKRFPSAADAAAEAWKRHYGPIAIDALEHLLTVAGLLDDPGDRAAFIAALGGFQAPNGDWRTIGELILVSAFEEALRTVVDHDLRARTEAWCSPNAGTDLVRATQRAYLVTLATGLVLVGGQRHDAGDLEPLYGQLFDALTRPTTPKDARDVVATMPLESNEFEFVTEDPAERKLFTAVLGVVARHGFDRATTQAIARAAASNEGLLFNRYPTKIHAFFDAITQHQATLMRKQNATVLALRAHHPPTIVDAAVLQRSLDPDREPSRVVGMEYLRASAYHPIIAESLTRSRAAIIDQVRQAQPHEPIAHVHAWVHYALAIGAGLGMLPLLTTNANRLPFNVVLEPLLTPPNAPESETRG